MTSLAALFDWLAAGSPEGRTASRNGNATDFRLRTLPKEDIHVFVKSIDNSTVIRLVDNKDWLRSAGMAGRASGQAIDLRCDHPWDPYAQLQVTMATQSSGDVAARVAIRFDEVFESLRLIRVLASTLPQGDTQVDLRPPGKPAIGAGWVEAWRGQVFVALQLGADARISRCHCHDPSWQNWPVLEHAVIGNIVPDFPLINKSFNLSYSGHDL